MSRGPRGRGPGRQEEADVAQHPLLTQEKWLQSVISGCATATSPGEGAMGWPSFFLGEKLVTVRDMKEQSKAHKTSCLDCETENSLCLLYDNMEATDDPSR